MAKPQYSRDDIISAPPGLDEFEQCAVMVKATKQYFGYTELTAVPADMPPLGHDWIPAGTIEADLSHRMYRVYLRMPAHAGSGPLGTRTNSPRVDHGTNAITRHKPKKTHDTVREKEQHVDDHKVGPKTKVSKSVDGLRNDTDTSAILIKAIKELQTAVSDPSAGEEQIVKKMQAGLLAMRGARDGDVLLGPLNEQISRALERIQDARNSAFERDLMREANSPGSVSEETLKKHVQNVLSGERQRQMMGIGSENGSRAMELTVTALNLLTNRKLNAARSLVSQEKRSPGSISDERLTAAFRDFLELDRQCQLLGISVPGESELMAEAFRISEQRKPKPDGS